MKSSTKHEAQKAFCYNQYLNPSSQLHPEFVRFDFNAGTQEFNYGSHRHTDHELIYVETGFYKARLNGEKLTLSPGQILLACPGDLHDDESRHGLQYYSLSFFLRTSPSSGSEIDLLKQGLAATDKVFKGDYRFVVDLMREAAETMANMKTGSAKLAHILLHELFWRFVQEIPDPYYSPDFIDCCDSNNFATNFFRTLDKNLSTTLELKDLAKKMAVSPSQLNKLCHKHLKNSPAQLVMDYKISRGKEMLANTDLPIREISDMLNFKDQFTFSRAFKRTTMLTPSAFRKQSEEID